MGKRLDLSGLQVGIYKKDCDFVQLSVTKKIPYESLKGKGLIKASATLPKNIFNRDKDKVGIGENPNLEVLQDQVQS